MASTPDSGGNSFNASTLQRFNTPTLQRFNAPTLHNHFATILHRSDDGVIPNPPEADEGPRLGSNATASPNGVFPG